MSKRSVKTYFFSPPPIAEVQACVQEMHDKSKTLRKRSQRSKLEPYIPTISLCLRNTNASLQMVCNLLLHHHKLRVNKSTLSRFVKGHPALTDSRKPTVASNSGRS